MLVSPVDFKESLEALDEHLRLIKGAVNDRLNAEVLSLLNFFVHNPALGVEENRLRFFPLALHVVPIFKGVGVVLQVLMLGPAGEALNLF